MLFFEHCLDWLAPGGKLGIIMPKSFLDVLTYKPARQYLFNRAKLLAVITCHKNTFEPDTGVRTCIVLVEKDSDRRPKDADYKIFMAISRKPGRNSEGIPVFKIASDGTTTEEIDCDLPEILDAFRKSQQGALSASEYNFDVWLSSLDSSLNINPQRYLPRLNESLRKVQELDGLHGWATTTLGQIIAGTKIFKGPRLRTENLIVEHKDDGVQVEPYFTPSAILQDKRDSVKWLDLARGSDHQLKSLEAVRVLEGDLLITRSGSVGRVAYITQRLHGAIVSDDAIRVRIPDLQMRAYAYAWLQSRFAQDQLLINEYGAVQQHLEPKHVADLLVPLPDDPAKIQDVISNAEAFFTSKEAMDSALEQLYDTLSAAIPLEEPSPALPGQS